MGRQKHMANNKHKSEIALFSGRFDPPTPSHIHTIIKLARRYKMVKVVLLDYQARRFKAKECLNVFTQIFKAIPLDVTFQTNYIHFAQITIDEINKFKPFDVYVAAQNKQVLDHIKSLNIHTYNCKRSLFYSARNYRVR